MRKALAALAILGVIIPSWGDASTTRPPLIPAKCSSPANTEALGSKTQLFTKDTNPAAAKQWLQNSMYCPNACYDLRVLMTLVINPSAQGLQVTITGNNKCASNTKAPDDPSQVPPRGCGNGQQQPQVTISTRDLYSNLANFHIPDQDKTRSRCDDSTLDSSLNSAFSAMQRVGSDPRSAEEQIQAALDRIGNAATAPAGASGALPQTAGTQALAQTLTNFGLPAAQAQQLAQSSPSAANSLIQAFVAQDAQKIQAAAGAAGIVLNPATIDQATKLTPAQVTSATSPLGMPPPTSYLTTGFGTTYAAPAQPQLGPAITSPFASFSGPGSSVPLPYTGSPFANMSPVPLPQAASAPVTLVPPPASTSTSPTYPPPQPSALILAQPADLFAGQSVLVSWSSVGMQSTSCQVLMGKSQIGSGTFGTKTVPTGSATARGSLTFTLTCTSLDGTQVQRTASTTVR